MKFALPISTLGSARSILIRPASVWTAKYTAPVEGSIYIAYFIGTAPLVMSREVSHSKVISVSLKYLASSSFLLLRGIGNRIGNYFVDVMQSNMIESLYWQMKDTSRPRTDLTCVTNALKITSSRIPPFISASKKVSSSSTLYGEAKESTCKTFKNMPPSGPV